MPNGLNCFTSLKQDASGIDRSKADVEAFFKKYGSLKKGKKTGWWPSKNGYLYYVVYFSDSLSCENACANSKNCFKPKCISRISKHGNNPPSTPSTPKSITKNNSQAENRPYFDENDFTFSQLDDFDTKILFCLRNFGLDEKRSKELLWNQFALLSVLPEKEYEDLFEKTGDELYETISKSAQFALPSSYTQKIDHPLEEDKLVLHAEVKLVGDPTKYPEKLSVPYDRCWLKKIIRNHEIKQWKNGANADSSQRFKIFLYSETKICDFCIDAIERSIYENLKVTGKIDENTKPVIGHSFGNVRKERELEKDESIPMTIISPRQINSASIRALSSDFEEKAQIN